MANRHLSRSVALQSLFEWDFQERRSQPIEEILARNLAEFAPGLEDDLFAHDLVTGVLQEQERLDHIIEKAAPDWPLAQIAIVDRNVLRLGLYELLFSKRNEVPAKVAINEAIELAKTFGGENSGRFVNGVLGAVYKELGEPGKDEAPKKKRPKDVPYEEMPIERLGGAVVYCREGQQIYLAFVHDIFGYWTLSKGHLEGEETLEEGTRREILEEMSLTITIEKELGANEYIASDPERGKIRKQVVYFLARAPKRSDLGLAKGKAGLDNARWFALTDIPDLRIYDDIVPLVTKAIKIITKQQDD